MTAFSALAARIGSYTWPLEEGRILGAGVALANGGGNRSGRVACGAMLGTAPFDASKGGPAARVLASLEDDEASPLVFNFLRTGPGLFGSRGFRGSLGFFDSPFSGSFFFRGFFTGASLNLTINAEEGFAAFPMLGWSAEGGRSLGGGEASGADEMGEEESTSIVTRRQPRKRRNYFPPPLHESPDVAAACRLRILRDSTRLKVKVKI